MQETIAENSPIHQKIKAALLIVLIGITAITCIRIPNCTSWKHLCLQHVGTLLLMVPLLRDTVRNRMSMPVFVCVTLFALFHVIGARWIYSYVPYREWSISYLGFSAEYWNVPTNFHGDIAAFFEEMTDELIKGDGDLTFRNHYDRLIHSSFGLFMYPYMLYKVRQWVEQKPLIAILVAWLLIQTGSMAYEIFEWQLSVWSDAGHAYNGQQGDMWDAQKDMALAMIGSTIMAIYYLIKDECKYRC